MTASTARYFHKPSRHGEGRAGRKFAVALVIMIRAAICLLLAIVLSVWVATPGWAGYAEGKAAFDEGDYEKAFEEFQSLAVRENINAQYYLGILYRNGWGVLQDDNEAARWFRFAAHQDHIEAQYTLGYMYQHGQGVTKDIVEAKRWYRKAANQGDAGAQQSLRIILYEEQNAPKPRRGDQGGFAMSANPSDWFDTALSLIIGLEDTMTVGDVMVIAAIVLIIIIPVVLPFSFYRIKPMLKEISDEAAERDRDLLEENKKIASLLRQIAEASSERDKAMLEAFRKISRTLNEKNNQRDGDEE